MHTADNPGVIAPPPLIYLAAFGLLILLRAVAPLRLPDGVRWLGLLLVVLSLIPGSWALVVMVRAGTNPEPSHPTTVLVMHGPFRFTRNPIYLSFTLFYLGVALLLREGWGLILIIPTLIIMHVGVIFREEAYLTRKFDDAYTQYRARVRRWL